MLYAFFGTDTQAARAKANALAGQLLAKKPNALSIRISDEEYDPAQLEELIYGQGLFEQRFIVIFDRVFSHKDHKESIIERTEDLAKSENIFVVVDGKLDAAAKKALTKHAEKVQEFEAKEKVKEDFNIFGLTDALARRDKKELWVLFQKAKQRGSAAEEIHGTLFWYVKSMLLASQSKSAEEAGLKPFVYGKAKGGTKIFSIEEQNRLADSLVQIYFDARTGKSDLDIALEKWVLSV